MIINVKSVTVFSRNFDKKSRFLSFLYWLFGGQLKSKCRYKACFYVKSKEDMPCLNDVLAPVTPKGNSVWLVSKVDSKNLCFTAWSIPTFDTPNCMCFAVIMSNCGS